METEDHQRQREAYKGQLVDLEEEARIKREMEVIKKTVDSITGKRGWITTHGKEVENLRKELITKEGLLGDIKIKMRKKFFEDK